MYDNKKIFILGMARSGYECARVLINETNDITIVDENSEDEHINELKSMGVKVFIDDRNVQDKYLDDTFDLVIKNPGVPLDAKVVVKANELSIPIINEVEVAYQMMPKGMKIVGITGSNGKTTTTTITYEILREAGLSVHLGGNIGIPITGMVKDFKENDILVMEVSSQQLNDVVDFKTDISIMTNINESHLDFFNTYEYYQLIKKKIFNHHNKDSIAIINNGDDVVLEIAEDISSRKITFSAKTVADLCIKNDAIHYRGEDIIKLTDIKLVGDHNYENCMCAIAVAKEFNVSNDIIYKVLSEFGGVEHRLQFVKEFNGRRFYNDSKATNVVATEIALKSFNTPVILLLGGLDRGHSFDDLLPFMDWVKHVSCYGETASRIKTWCCDNSFLCHEFNILEEAVNDAYNVSSEGDTILLSPACASWDQYKKFEDRGDDFARIVNNIKR